MDPSNSPKPKRKSALPFLSGILVLLIAPIIYLWISRNFLDIPTPWASSTEICRHVHTMAQSPNASITIHSGIGRKASLDRELLLSLFQEDKLTPCWIQAKVALYHRIRVSDGGSDLFIDVCTKAKGKWLLRAGDSWYVTDAPDLTAPLE
jgi:hypothetical protein